jgi:hypothetical protein
MKTAVFWDVVLCSLAEVYWNFRGALLHPSLLWRSSRCLWYIAYLLPVYTAQHPRRHLVRSSLVCSSLQRLGFEISLPAIRLCMCMVYFRLCTWATDIPCTVALSSRCITESRYLIWIFEFELIERTACENDRPWLGVMGLCFVSCDWNPQWCQLVWSAGQVFEPHSQIWNRSYICSTAMFDKVM